MAVGLALWGAACQANPPGGTLELQWVLSPGSGASPSVVIIVPDWAGAGQGATRWTDWYQVRLLESSRPLALRPRRQVTVARGFLPAGRYSHVYVAASVAWAEGNRQQRIISHIEPIARGFELRAGQRVTVEIELTVLPRAVDGQWQLFVRHARLIATASRQNLPGLARPTASAMANGWSDPDRRGRGRRWPLNRNAYKQ